MTAPWWFALPAIVTYAAMVVIPSFQGAAYAFTDWNGLNPDPDWVGLDNFVRIFNDPVSLSTTGRTLVYAISGMILVNVAGLALAVALNTRIRSRNVLRTVFFAPAVLSPLVIGYIFKFILSPDGSINRALFAVGLDGLTANWLGDPSLAIWSIVAVNTWQGLGTAMVIYLAGLQGVPPELLEAAEVDGAGAWRRFRHVTFPLLAAAVTINSLLTLISGLRVFDQIYAMTQGGPAGSTHSLATLFVQQAYEFNRFGYAAALAVVLSVLVATFSFLQLRIARKGTER